MSKASQAIVIGSGFGGLGAAARLRAMGYEVKVLEGNTQPGGRAAVFRKDGFTFDAGPTVITAPYLLSELFELLGARPEDYYQLMPVDPFYRIVFNDKTEFDYVGDENQLIENIRKLSPEDVAGYHKLSQHAQEIFKVGYEDLADKPFSHFSDMVKVIPDMLRLQNYRSVYGLVSKYIKDERLRQAFSFEPLLVGGNPFSITSIYLLIHWLERKWGVHFVKGGTNALVSALVQLLNDRGVEVKCRAQVEKIDVFGRSVRGVRTTDGKYYPADVVVSNADPIKVYGEMVDAQFRKKHSDRSLKSKSQSMSLFVIYFGTKKTYPDLAHHTILMGPRYKELLKDIFGRKHLAEDFSLYLHAPTRSDSSMAPPGHECFYVLSPVPNNESGINWSEEGPRYKQKILDWLDQNYLPGLKENLVTSQHIDPDYFENTLRTTAGSGFGLEPSFSQSAWFRFHNESEDIDGLYFVGASTHPGAGVPGVLSSAKVLDRMVPLPAKSAFSQVPDAKPFRPEVQL